MALCRYVLLVARMGKGLLLFESTKKDQAYRIRSSI
jgi:hypothetical protein